jgi:transposase
MTFMRKGEDPPWTVVDEPVGPDPAAVAEVERRSRYPGMGGLNDRRVLCGILFVLHTGIRWEFLPKELGSNARNPHREGGLLVRHHWGGAVRGPRAQAAHGL